MNTTSNLELKLTVMEPLITVEMSGRPSLRYAWKIDKLELDTVTIFADWLTQEDKVSRRKEFEVLGSHLYKLLFQGDVETEFKTALAKVENNERLHVLLSFEGNSKVLEALPWEYLFFPESDYNEGYFFATKEDLVLSRYVPNVSISKNLLPVEDTLRFLLVVSDPETKDIDIERVDAGPIIEAIKKLKERYPIDPDNMEEKLTLENFENKLKSKPYDVLHFFAHCRYNQEKKRAELAIPSQDGNNMEWFPDQQFTECIAHSQSFPRLIFLHLFGSSKKDFNANFDSLAPTLIRIGIQAVVAMKYPIATTYALTFCRNFYETLLKGNPVDVAVQEGRYSITKIGSKAAYENRVFGTPIVYAQSCDIIFKPVVQIPSTKPVVQIPSTAFPLQASSENKLGEPPGKVDAKPKAEPTHLGTFLTDTMEKSTLPPSTIPPIQGGEPATSLEDVGIQTKEIDVKSLIEGLIEEARKKIKNMNDLTIGEKVKLYERIRELSDNLAGKQLEDIVEILLEERSNHDEVYSRIIQSILDSLGAMK